MFKRLFKHKNDNFSVWRVGLCALKITHVAALVVVLVGISASQDVDALPQGGVIAGGNTTISQPNAGTLQINQQSQRSVINWQTYNVGAHESVHYQQPNASSISLNRVNPQNGVSKIYGSITANGQVWFSNPAGIFFGPTAYVNVAGMLATTANISDADFMAGNYHFVQDAGWNGSVINEGTIIVFNAGLAALVGPGVVNNGMITATLGTVVLASGTEYTIDFNSDQLIQFAVGQNVSHFATDQNGKPLPDLVSNAGKVYADGGKVLMTTHGAINVLDHAINMSGYVEAKSLSTDKGEIVFGADDGTVRVSGTVVASGRNPGESGGTIKILGSQVQVLNGAKIDAVGDVGGGEVLIGGNAHGQGPEQNADATYIANTVMINADALTMGNGGKVVVWSNNDTEFFGSIFARGGMLGGNGGWIETSGHQYLSVNGSSVNTVAAKGVTGTWLLDPSNIYIAANQTNATNAGMVGTDTSANTVSGGTSQASGAVQDSLLTTAILTAALGTSSVVVTTTNASGTGVGNITVVDPFSWSTSANTLTLTAANNIFINAAITTGNTSNAALILNAAGNVTQTAAIGGSGGLTVSGAGTVTLSQTNTYTGKTTLSAGIVKATNVQALGAASAPLSLNGGTLDLATDSSITAYNTTVTATSTIVSDKATPASVGITHTLGTLSIGAQTLNITVGANVTSGTAGVTFGTTTLTAGPAVFDTAASTNLTLGAVGGAFALTKQDAGQMTLATTSARTTVAGSTTLTGGTLRLNIANALNTSAAAALNLNGGTLSLGVTAGATYGGTATTLGGNATVESDLLVAGAGVTQTLGTLSIGALTLNITAGSNVTSGTAGVTFGVTTLTAGSAVFNTAASTNLTLGAVGGAFDLTKQGLGQMTLATTSTRTTTAGTTTLTAGTLRLNIANALNTNAATAFNLNGGTLSLGVTAGATYGGTAIVWGGPATIVSDRLTVGAGVTQTLGVLSIGANTLTIAAGSNVTSGTAGVTFGATTLTSDLTVNAPTGTLLTLGALNDSGTARTITKNGAGAMTVATAATSLIDGTQVNISTGTLNSNQATALGSLAKVDVADGAIFSVGASQTIGALTNATTVTNTGSVTIGAFTLTVGNADNLTSSFTGLISGAGGSLTKAGTGNLTLSNTNTYGGTTTISAGTLFAANTQALGVATAHVTLTGGTLDLATDTSITAYNTTVSAGATIVSDTATAGSAGITHTLGTLSIGAQTLNITVGNNVTSGIAGVTFGATTLSAGPAVFNTAANTNLTLGALGGAFAITKQGLGQMTLGTTSTRITAAGSTTLSAGTLRLNIANALNTSAAAALNLNGGTLSLGVTAGATYGGTAIVWGGSATVESDRLTAGAGVTQTLGALSIGANTLTIAAGSNVTSGTAGVTFGATTLTSDLTVNAPTGTLLTLGVLNDSGTARTITKNGAGAMTVATAATSLIDGTQVNISNGTLNSNQATALGALAKVDIADGATFGVGATQTIGALTNTTTVTNSGNVTIGAFTLTVGNADNLTSTFTGLISGAGGSLTKAGTGNLTLSNTNTYGGTTTISAGTLFAANTQALGVATAHVTLTGGTLDLATDTSITAYNTTVSAGATIVSDTATAGSAGITHTLGTLSIGAQTLNITVGNNVTSGIAGVTFGTTTLSAGPAIFNTAANTNLTLGAIGGAFAITKQGLGQMTLATTSTRTTAAGSTTLSAGTLRLNIANALNTNAATVLNLNGGTLSLGVAAGATYGGTAVVWGAPATIESDRLTAGAGVTQTLGTLSVGTQTVNIVAGSNVTSGTAGITFGATTFTGTPTFNPAAGTLLTLGALNDGVTARTITMSGAGVLTLSAAATSLINGTQINISSGTLNSNQATALGALATVDVADGATFGVGATQTIGALTNTTTVSNTGSVVIGTFILTIGNAANNLTSNFSGIISGATGSLTKASTATLTLSNANTYGGTTAINAGTLKATNTQALGVATATISMGGGTLDLATDTSMTSYNTIVTATSTIISDKATAASAGITHTLGTLTIGAQTLNLTAGANVASGTAGLTFGNTTFSATGPIFDTAANTSLTLGALQSIGNFTKQNSGQINLLSAANAARISGIVTLTAGTMLIGSPSALGTAGVTLVLNSGTLDIATDTSINAHNTTVGGTISIVSDRATSGAGVTQTLGTLSVGTRTINLNVGANVSSGTAGLTFGATTMTGNPTFNPASGALLTLGAMTDGAVARTITKIGAGSMTVATAAASLITGTQVNISNGTLNSNQASALGALATVDIADGATFGVGASQTIGALTNTTTVNNTGSVSIGAVTLTIGNVANNLTSNFSGIISGSSGSLAKAGTGTLTLSNANTYGGTTTITAGILKATNVQALGVSTASISMGGGTLDLLTDSSITAYNTTVTATSTIISDKATAASAGITHTLGTLTIGAQTLNLTVGANVTSGTAGLTFGNTSFSASGAIFDTAANTSLTLGALQSIGNFTKQNTGQISLNSAANAARVSGAVTLTAGSMILGNPSALGTTGVTQVLNGGTLDIATDTSINAYNTTVGGTATIVSDRATNGAGITQTLGTLSVGTRTINLNVGANVSSGTAGLTFGATTFTGNPTFNTASSTLLTLGAIGDGAAARTIVKTGAGTLSVVGTATSLVNGTVINISNGTLNANQTAALGALATVDVADGATFGVGANQTVGALTDTTTVNNTGSVSIGAFTLTVGNATNNLTSNFSDIISGPSGSLTKSGTGTLTLSNANTYGGTTTITAGTLKATNTQALGVSTATLSMGGGTLDLVTDTSITPYNTTVTATSTIISDKATAASAGITHTLGTLTIGAQTLNLTVGANVTSGTAGLTFGSTSFSASGAIFDTAVNTSLTLGALQSIGNFTKQNSGQITLNTAANAARISGAVTLTAGTMLIGNVSALGTSGVTLQLNGGLLDLATDTSINAYNTTVGGTATIIADRATGGAGITHTLGTLSIGTRTLDLTVGSNVTSGTAGLTFGNTTFSASGAVFDTAANTLLTLGALQSTGNFTKQDSGQIVLNTAANAARTSGLVTLTAGTMTLGSPSALGIAAVGLVLNGGTLDIATDTTINAHNTTIGGTVNIISDRATSGAGITQTLGTLSISAQTLNLTAGSNVASGTAGLTFGATTFSASGPVFDTAASTNLTLGALQSVGNFTKQDSGQITLNNAANVARTSGTVTLTAGTMKIGNVSALGTIGVSLQLNAGTLDLATDTTVNAYNATLSGAMTIISDRATSGAGITQTLGTLSIGAQPLTLNAGTNVASGTAGLTFGATTLSSNPTFTSGASTLLTLGALNDGAVARTITKSGAGAMTLAAAASSLVDGTQINISAGTLNANQATALGALAVIDVADGATFGVGATQTIGALTNTTTINNTGNVSIGAFTLTVGNATNNLASNFSGVISGVNGGIAKAGSATFTLSGVNTYGGATQVGSGILNIANKNSLGNTSGTSVTSGATLDLTFGSNTLGNANTITLNGTGVGGNGALTLSGASITLNNPISLGSTSLIGGSGTGLMTLGGAITGTSVNLSINLVNASISLPAITLNTSGTLGVITGGAITQSNVLTIAGTSNFNAGANSITLTQANAFTGAVTLTTTGANDATINNNIGLSLAASNIGRKLTATSSGTLTLSGSLTANATGDSIVLSGTRFDNSGAFSLTPGGSGRYLVWSSNANPFGGGTPDIRGGLTYNFKQYNVAFGGTVLGSGNGFLYTFNPTITVSLIDPTPPTTTPTKVYDGSLTGASLVTANYTNSAGVDGDSVTLTGSLPTSGNYASKNVGTLIGVTASGLTNSNLAATNGAATVYGYQLSSTNASGNIGTITTAAITVSSDSGQTKIYGNDDPVSAATAYSLTSGTLYDSLTGTMGRVTGETVGNYDFTQNTVTVNDGNGGNNYNITFNGTTHPFSITQRPATGAIANQSKVYGANDPSLPSITVNLGNIVNRTVVDINGTATPINDTANVATTLASLTRAVGETVGGSPYSISAATFNALTGSAASNYSGPTFTGSPTLAITQASLTGSIANQSKVYGAVDPSLGGIGVTLAGLINNPAIYTWNGNVAINDSALTSSLTGLTRAVGENIGVRSITAGAFTTPSTNYSAPTLSGSPTLTITQASLTGLVANQSKVYGADDPTLSGIGVTLTGLINNPSIYTWNGNVAINDSALTSNVTALTRGAGENVGVRAISAGTFTSASANYSLPTFTGSPTLTISQASLTGLVANQSKIYGADDPTLSSVGVTLNGLINNPVIYTWNGNVAINDSGLTSNVTALTRATGENVGVRAITAGTFTSASANYTTPTFTGSPTLTITQASLGGSIANQTKVYGDNDPALSGIGVTLSGIINNPAIVTWNGNASVNDTGNVSTTLAALTRNAGEDVATSPYSITAAVFNALTGSAAANYQLPILAGVPTLAITKTTLTATIPNQSKIYGTSDPAPTSIDATLGGIINNPAVVTWNGNVSIDDVGQVTSTLASYTRAPGESVLGSPYAIITATFNPLTGSASGNYTAPTSFSNSPTLSILPATLTVTLTGNVTKVYDQSTSALLANSNYILNGVVGADDVSLNDPTNGLYDNANAGSSKLVSVSGLAISGLSASNYQLASTSVSNTIGLITPAPLTISGVIANNKIFNGTTSASLNFTVASLSGALPGDVVSIDTQSYAASFITPNVGNNIPVNVSYIGLNGSSSANYTLSLPIVLSASIFTGTNSGTNPAPYSVVFPIEFSAQLQSTAQQTVMGWMLTNMTDTGAPSVGNPIMLSSGCVEVSTDVTICKIE